MKELARQARAENHIVGLVPTMGALHEGHTSLVNRARQECSKIFASIFVNPKQFAPNEDLAKYPRTLEADLEKLAALSIDGVFVPESSEMYPKEFRTYVNVEGLSDRLEGRSRPGHFRGVATVVLKLLDIVQPQFAFFGRKDAQQVRIIQQMAHDLNLGIEIVACPIVREPDGLALSSRNSYLKPDERRSAASLYRALDAARREITAGVRDAPRILSVVRGVLESEKLVTVDYVEIADAVTFEPVARIGCQCHVLVAAFVGTTRLIDNLLVEPIEDSGKLICHL